MTLDQVRVITDNIKQLKLLLDYSLHIFLLSYQVRIINHHLGFFDPTPVETLYITSLRPYKIEYSTGFDISIKEDRENAEEYKEANKLIAESNPVGNTPLTVTQIAREIKKRKNLTIKDRTLAIAKSDCYPFKNLEYKLENRIFSIDKNEEKVV